MRFILFYLIYCGMTICTNPLRQIPGKCTWLLKVILIHIEGPYTILLIVIDTEPNPFPSMLGGPTVRLTIPVPCSGVAVVSHLHVHLVQARRKHREETGDVRVRPLRYGTPPPPANHHGAVVAVVAKVRTQDGENSVTYSVKQKKKRTSSTTTPHWVSMYL